MIKVLHITPWFPSQKDISGVFVKEHIDSLAPHVQQFIFHLNVSEGRGWKIISEKRPNFQKFVMKVPFTSWKLIEIIQSFLLLWVLWTHGRKYDLINFHIAYPNLRYWGGMKKLIKKPVMCIEHWSIYGQNFGLKQDEKGFRKLKGVRKIFHHKEIKLVAVSDHLAGQLKSFSGNQDLKVSILPNVVNDCFIHDSAKKGKGISFLMASVWREGKRPFEVIEGFSSFVKTFPDAELIIAGDGPLVSDMEKLVEKEGLESSVKFLGLVDKENLALELNKASTLIHASDHETFSAICAESLCTGTPIIVSKLPAVMEYMRETDGIVVSKHTGECWHDAMVRFQKIEQSFIPAEIAKSARKKFSRKAVGRMYFEMLKQTYESYLKVNDKLV